MPVETFRDGHDASHYQRHARSRKLPRHADDAHTAKIEEYAHRRGQASTTTRRESRAATAATMPPMIVTFFGEAELQPHYFRRQMPRAPTGSASSADSRRARDAPSARRAQRFRPGDTLTPRPGHCTHFLMPLMAAIDFLGAAGPRLRARAIFYAATAKAGAAADISARRPPRAQPSPQRALKPPMAYRLKQNSKCDMLS